MSNNAAVEARKKISGQDKRCLQLFQWLSKLKSTVHRTAGALRVRLANANKGLTAVFSKSGHHVNKGLMSGRFAQRAHLAYREIPLTQGKVAIVDQCDFERVNQFKWFYKKSSCNGYAARSIHVNGKCSTLRLHTFITNRPDGMEVDHRNEDTLDNRRANLVVCEKNDNLRWMYKRKKQAAVEGEMGSK